MNKSIGRMIQTAATAFLLCFCVVPAALAVSPNGPDYEQPTILTGAIYQLGSHPDRILFTFRRTSIRAGSTVQVLREYLPPDGALAARERAVYENGRLVSFEVEQLQTGAKGSATLREDRLRDNRQSISFDYLAKPGARIEKKSEGPRKAVLISDMIPSFLLDHWNELTNGAAVKFRFIVLERAETVGFKLAKESESTWRGQPVIIVKMDPTSPIIARLVDPVRFTIETQGRHRILAYSGRTTPMIKHGNTWQDLDALTVFDWK